MINILKKSAVLTALGAALFLPVGAQAAPELPEATYEWAQSTSRQGYYFNKAEMCFAVQDGYVDIDHLIVPAVRLYDSVQIEDVVSKRRWNGLDLDGYGALAGAADYLEFNLAKNTIRVTEHDDLDDGFNVLSASYPEGETDLNTLPEKSVDAKFYAAILKYAEEHEAELLARTKGELKPEDGKRLEARHRAAEPGLSTEPQKTDSREIKHARKNLAKAEEKLRRAEEKAKEAKAGLESAQKDYETAREALLALE